jgi:hypothetical protein
VVKNFRKSHGFPSCHWLQAFNKSTKKQGNIQLPTFLRFQYHSSQVPKQGVCVYLKAKEELWKLEYFTMQKYNLQKNSSHRNQNPSRYHNSITNFKFQHKPKYQLSKILV